MNIERTITIDNRSWLGLMLLRVLSPRKCSIPQYKDEALAHLREENNYEHRGKDVIDGELDTLARSPIIFYKWEQVIDPETHKELYYVQMVIDCGAQGSHFDIVRDMAGYIYSVGYNPDWVVSRTQTDMYITLGNIHPNRNSYVNLLLASSVPNDFIRETFSYIKDIAIKFDLKNMGQIIKQGTPYKVIINFYNHIVEALMNKNSRTLVISNYANDGIGLLLFGQYKEIELRQFVYKQHYDEKIKAKLVGKTLVVYDGEKSFECIEPYISKWAQYKVGMLDILQFSHHKDFFFQDNLRDGALRKIVFHFINQDKISIPRSRLVVERGIAYGQVCFMPGKNLKPKHVDIVCRNSRGYIGEFVIPVNKDNVQFQAMKLIDDHILNVLSGMNTQPEEFIKTYQKYLFNTHDEQVEDDILSEWFKNCVRTNKRTARGIVYSYMHMKEQLEKEYNSIKNYVECFDFSKCKPVPSIQMDKKLKKNYYKTLHIEPENIIINKINNKKIKEISQIKPTVSFNFIDNRKMLNVGKASIYDFYNSTTNSIQFEFNKMKGMVTHDKVKNRG